MSDGQKIDSHRVWICYPDYIGWPGGDACTSTNPLDHNPTWCGWHTPPAPSPSTQGEDKP